MARLARAVVLLPLLLAAVPPAGAQELGRVADGADLVAGPVFAGAEAVWVERDGRGALFVARSGRPARSPVGGPPGAGLRHDVADLAASASRVALVRRVVRPPPPYTGPPCVERCPSAPMEEPRTVADEVWAAPLGARLRRLTRIGARTQCGGALTPVEVEAGGRAVVVAEAVSPYRSCSRYVVPRMTGRVVAHRSGPGRPIARFRAEPGIVDRRLAAEGAWAAWRVHDRGLVVFDLRRGRVAYRVRDRRDGNVTADVDGAGRLALLGREDSVSPCHPREPRPHRAVLLASPDHERPVRIATSGHFDALALSRGRAAFSAVEPRCFDPIGMSLLDTRGAARPFELPCTWHPGNFDRPAFDGRRLLYAAPAEGCSPNGPLRVIAAATA